MGKINLSVGSCEKNGVMAGLGVPSSSETLTTCMSHQLQFKIDGVESCLGNLIKGRSNVNKNIKHTNLNVPQSMLFHFH